MMNASSERSRLTAGARCFRYACCLWREKGYNAAMPDDEARGEGVMIARMSVKSSLVKISGSPSLVSFVELFVQENP